LPPIIRVALLTAALVGAPASAAAQGPISPFQEDVNTAIEAAAGYLLAQQADDGGWPTAHRGEGSALAALCILEQPLAPNLIGVGRGYEDLVPEAQEAVDRAMVYIARHDPAFSGGGAHSNLTGVNLMASSVYLLTGGREDVVEGEDLASLISGAGEAMIRIQDQASGGWRYTFWDGQGDVSCAQLASAGLAAAAGVDEDLLRTLPPLLGWVDTTAMQGGGHSYFPGGGRRGAGLTFTASALWSEFVAGRPASHANVQAGLEWLQRSWNPSPDMRWGFYFMWTVSKALHFATNDGGLEDGVFAEDIGGARDPAEEGYPTEGAGWYFDLAAHLLANQADDGSWGAEALNTSWGCLVLERSFGGVCLDLDEDGLCELEDNCPLLFNPGQEDSDFDGEGDACDNCPRDANAGQEDADRDGIGDACDKYNCRPTGDEVCDQVDNDCNEAIDDVPGTGVACPTGLPGACALGGMVCAGGDIICVPTNGEDRQERCDLIDNDCDGEIDEGLLNACGRCRGDRDAEICNGRDDDCDGRIDDDEGLCGQGEVCIHGTCATRCDGGQEECVGFLMCIQGYCLGACAGTTCPGGQVCDQASGNCFDPCDDIDCAEGQLCRLGRCGSCAEVGCPDGSMCREGTCVDDPCAGVDCHRGMACLSGECVDSCAHMSCPLFQSCVDGACEADPCGGIPCLPEEACVAGECVEDTCAGQPNAECAAAGRICAPGVEGCLPDPCVGTRCAPNEICDSLCRPSEDPAGVECVARCMGDWRPRPEPPGPGPGEEGEGEGEGVPSAEGEGEVQPPQPEPWPEPEPEPEPGPEVPTVDEPAAGDGVEDPASCGCGLSGRPSAGPAWRLLLRAILRG
jgi:hypothetical protein